MTKRTFNLEPEVDDYLQTHRNRSKTINEIVKRHMQMLNEEQMIRAYQQMFAPGAMAEFHEWERATLVDGLTNEIPESLPGEDNASSW